MTAPGAPDSADASPLFRSEVIEGRRPQMTGEVLLTARRASRWAAGLAGVSALALVTLVAAGSYTRRAAVSGYLAPDQGVVRLYAPATATVLEQRVREGQQVDKGEVLYVLSTDRIGPGEVDYQQAISGTLEERRRSLEVERQAVDGAGVVDLQALRQRLQVSRHEREQLGRQLQALELQIQGAEETRLRYRDLFQQGLVTRDVWQDKERETLELRQRLQGLVREQLALQRLGVELGQQLEAAQARRVTQQQSLGRELAALREQYTGSEARRRVIVTAPHGGRATLVQGLPGSTVDGSRPLLTLLPEQVTLQAQLYAPSRAVGFIRPGTSVWLRHEAYPYQKFGHQEGEVVSVSTFPAELDELVGLAAFADAANREPLYAITVRLRSQSMPVQGQAQPLRPGLRVQADLMMERRRLYEWMLEPLFGLRRAVSL
ncbi:membrane fusion protein [Sphaerotilus hippei]|uniref:Membrane fusion protein n=1 Tax=Sphaerotilus hippei TaxID=744406 RepID=A0A318H5T3_9BURK|nr:HlyD family efflux transporter periplasmic adaptor subunit [Sphaerotilus hippei]PXW94544.1 membrane fusion protein [Sphaerotilus hippei]